MDDLKKQLLMARAAARREAKRRVQAEHELDQALHAIFVAVEAFDDGDDEQAEEARSLLSDQLKLTHYDY